MVYREADHVRSRIGRYAHRTHGAPAIDLGQFGSRSVIDFADDAPLRVFRPYDQSELFAALDCSKPDAGGRVRHVQIAESMVQLSGIEIRGPKDGRPLLIDIDALTGSLDIVEGYVVVRVNSPWPIDINVRGEANCTIVVARGRSSMVEAHDSSNALVITEEGARGVLRLCSADSDGEVIGDSHTFKKASTWSWEI